LVIVGLETLVVGLEALVVGRIVARVALIGRNISIGTGRNLVVGILGSRGRRSLVAQEGLVAHIRIGIDSTIVHHWICYQFNIIVRFMIALSLPSGRLAYFWKLPQCMRSEFSIAEGTEEAGRVQRQG
jgi:hypothetical protein